MNSILIYFLTLSASFFAATVTGDGVYDYNSQVCCSGGVFNLSTSSTAGGVSINNFQCCGNQYLQVNENQMCCNNAVLPIPDDYESPSCCGGQIYDSSNSTCCNNTVVPTPNGGYASCCGSQTYNSSIQVCCYQSGKVLNKPPSNCPSSGYYSCCGDRLAGPNQQCCNGVVINPSTTLTSYSYGNYNTTSYCCSGGGIVQNPNKETCCNGGGVMPIVGPNSGCCGGLFYNTSTQICCGTKIYSNTNYGFGCCGNNLYDYNHQTCCNGTVSSNANGTGCCGSTTYNYNTQICCNNVLYNQPANSSLSCCSTPTVYYS